jgi:acetyltransferase-like isoleucine patch superfamily enzyme
MTDSRALSKEEFGAGVPVEKPRARGNWYRYLAKSDGGVARAVRGVYRGVRTFSLPAPRVIVRPMALGFEGVRGVYYQLLRIFICEPYFKAHCARYGKNLRTDCYLHWFDGKGDIICGDGVRVDGKCAFVFGSRFAERPVLEFGDNSGCGHGCRFVVGKRISIGRDTVISGETVVMDSNGHRTDFASRMMKEPPRDEEVRPVIIGNGVWIGTRCMIFPGVKIGDGSVVAAGSVVRSHVPAYTVVAGNPARVVFRLKRPDSMGAKFETRNSNDESNSKLE